MIENKDKWAREIAAQCWCDKETENKTMDVSLAMAVAKRIAFAYDEGRKAERERCLRMVYQYTTWEFDGSGGKPSLSVSTVDDIVAAIKGEKDGK
jgi:hypothetical protein